MKTRKSFRFDFRSYFGNVRKSMVWTMLCLAVCIFGLCVSATAQWPKIIPINAPGAGTGADQGTEAIGINTAGEITGFYFDSKGVAHGFVRTPDGRFTTFEAPGAGNETVTGFYMTPAGIMAGQGTLSVSINAAGTVTGFFFDKDDVAHGFVRTADGRFTILNALSEYAGSGPGQGTEPGNINSAGVVWGNTVDSDGAMHGFLWTPDGKFTIVDVPGAGSGNGQGTNAEWATCINPAGEVTGTYIDSGNMAHGFIRTPDGAITDINVSGAGTGAGQGTYSWSINVEGAVTAEYVTPDGVAHGYVRTPKGFIIPFNVPGAGDESGQGTIGEGNNSAGVVAGDYIDGSGVIHGFLRAPDGTFTYVNAPNAGQAAGQGTIPLTISDAGATVGVYLDSNGASHGILVLPMP